MLLPPVVGLEWRDIIIGTKRECVCDRPSVLHLRGVQMSGGLIPPFDGLRSEKLKKNKTKKSLPPQNLTFGGTPGGVKGGREEGGKQISRESNANREWKTHTR